MCRSVVVDTGPFESMQPRRVCGVDSMYDLEPTLRRDIRRSLDLKVKENACVLDANIKGHRKNEEGRWEIRKKMYNVA
jgi:hypothetical protein